MSLEKFIEGISKHISKKTNIAQDIILGIIHYFEESKNEFLVKEDCRVEIEHEGEFLLEVPVFNLVIDLSRERDHYKSLCDKHGIESEY